MPRFSNFLKKLVDDKAEEIQQGMIAKILSFDKEKFRADIQPQLSVAEGDSELIAAIPDVPVQALYAGGYYIRPEYKKGDLVWVAFATHDIDEALEGNVRPASAKTFGLENAVVIGGVLPSNFTPPSEFGSESGLLIGEESGNAFMKFGASDITFKLGSLEVKISSSGIEVKDGANKTEISAGDVKGTKAGVFTTLKAHQHPTAATGPPSPPLPNM